ncbi:MAG: ADP-ribosylglycohydrolase family protein, partial [Candidatus Solibacter sp.]|nr:ADP-ribosylglycohydrolase family protein [Candidatus Solibacter sp.]
FDESPLDQVMQRAMRAMDPKSVMAEAVTDARSAFQQHPADWKAARRQIHDKWLIGRKWNDNSITVNGAMVVLALLYGDGDFYRTLQFAMALGDDADCNAATAGAVLGYRLGFQRIAALPQFRMPDRYVNKTRPTLPAECKVSEQAETLLRVAERVILANGGKPIKIGAKPGFRVALQQTKVLEPLPTNPHGPGGPK